MDEPSQKFPWFRLLAVVLIVALFTADYAFAIMAKAPPFWAYLVPALLALGIEGRAVGRLLMQVVRAMARVPQEEADKGKDEQ